MSDCKKCGNPYDHHRFPQTVRYDKLTTAHIGKPESVKESLHVTCGRCGYSWEEPTKDQR